jgi:MFS family permease
MGLSLRQFWPRLTQDRGVAWSIVTGFTNTVFAYLAMTYSPVVILFLGELGLSKTQIGAISSLLPFSGLLALVVAPAVMRWGLKRTFVTFWTIRKFIVLLLVFTPLVLARGGVGAAFLYFAGIVAVFAGCRAISETAFNPWSLEFVPHAIRGQYGAISQISSTIANFLGVGIASFVMGRVAGLDKYVILIVIGVGFGLCSALAATRIPRESALGAAGGARAHFRAMREALRNAEYLLYLGGYGLTLLAAAVSTFLPLFMKEQAGLSDQAVVSLQTGSLLGSLLFGYLWGWLADRYGSRPVMLINLAVRVLLPLGWLFMPRHSPASLPAALIIAFFDGASNLGFHIGASRLLYVRIVPPALKTSYLAVHYAWIGVIGGIAPLVAGRVLDALAGLAGHWGALTLDAYTFLFLAGAVLWAVSVLIFSRVRSDGGSAGRAGGVP